MRDVPQHAVLDWFAAAEGLTDRAPTRERKRIAMDEKVIHLPGGDVYLSAAIDLHTGEIAMIRRMAQMGRYAVLNRRRSLL